MLKKLLALVVMLYAAASFAAVDVNKASAAELDGIKGIGPGISPAARTVFRRPAPWNWSAWIRYRRGRGCLRVTARAAIDSTVMMGCTSCRRIRPARPI